nr:hypothetical protein [Leptospira stimsonii]
MKNLISSLPIEIERPDFFKDLAILTDYAVSTRYPGDYEEILLPEYEKAIFIAQQAFDWAEVLIRK